MHQAQGIKGQDLVTEFIDCSSFRVCYISEKHHQIRDNLKLHIQPLKASTTYDWFIKTMDVKLLLTIAATSALFFVGSAFPHVMQETGLQVRIQNNPSCNPSVRTVPFQNSPTPLRFQICTCKCCYYDNTNYNYIIVCYKLLLGNCNYYI